MTKTLLKSKPSGGRERNKSKSWENSRRATKSSEICQTKLESFNITITLQEISSEVHSSTRWRIHLPWTQKIKKRREPSRSEYTDPKKFKNHWGRRIHTNGDFGLDRSSGVQLAVLHWRHKSGRVDIDRICVGLSRTPIRLCEHKSDAQSGVQKHLRLAFYTWYGV